MDDRTHNTLDDLADLFLTGAEDPISGPPPIKLPPKAAFGAPGPIDSDLGADGVSELFELVLPFSVANWDMTLPDASLHLHRTDGDGEWLLVNDGGRIKMSLEHAKGDAAVRASGTDLLLLSWERIGLDAPGVETFGDAEAARAWFALSR